MVLGPCPFLFISLFTRRAIAMYQAIPHLKSGENRVYTKFTLFNVFYC